MAKPCKEAKGSWKWYVMIHTFYIGFTIINWELETLKFIVLLLKGVGSNQPKKKGRGTVKGKTVVNKRVKERNQKLSIEFS